MKTLIVSTLTLLLVAFAACGSQSDTSAQGPTTPVAAAAPADAPAGPTAESAEPADHHDADHAMAAVDPNQPVVANGDAKVGDTTTCPVSHETFVVHESSPHVEYQGKTYYFCCPGCAGKFEKDPAKFLTAR